MAARHFYVFEAMSQAEQTQNSWVKSQEKTCAKMVYLPGAQY